MSTDSSASHSHTNALIHETSPYLLQHAHNPVDWHAWGEEAFAKAARENKPIFLSVGYSTCYWCHVMERQSFENEAIAAEMNRLFVNIKVDREERPDVDQLYMTAVQVQTRQGGWPMTVFLTPKLRYFYGGTYFPPTDAYGRPGFLTLLRAISDAWQNRRGDVEQTATQFLQILKQSSQPAAPTEPVTIDRNAIESLIEQSTSDYDSRHGGFGGAPKFPRETVLELLLTFLKDDRSKQSDLRDRTARQLIHTLDAMADGGIRDHLGGGFHRYSTDARWLVPHFEIMLYDNAMLGWIYAEAFAQFRQPRHEKVARGIFDFVLREMTSPDGGFYTAFDAEVDAQEGLSYLWTPAQIEAVLGPEDAELFNRVYGVSLGPNFADPHHGSGQPDQNILYLAKPLDQIAAEWKVDQSELEARLAPLRQKLLAARAERKQPLLDTKILTSWNALMIRALAHGGKVFSEPRYIAAAARAADFLLQHHVRDSGGLYRTSREGKTRYSGFLDDYAALAQALLAVHDATQDSRWLDHARSIAQSMLARFGDNRPGLFFTDADAKDLEVRQKMATDSPLPSGNALAALSLLELGEFDAAARIIGVFAAQMIDYGAGMSAMVQAAMNYVTRLGPIRINPGEQTSEMPMQSAARAPETVRAVAQWKNDREILLSLEILDGFHINANDVSSVDAQLIATRVAVIGQDNAVIEYPPAQLQRFEYSNDSIPVYSGKIQILIRLPDKSARRASQLSLTFQACSDSACLAPVTRTIDVTE